MPSKYYIVGDDAYCAAEQVVVPYPGNHPFRDPYDNFNFFQSSTRMSIECAFGMLVRRFGVFWRKMEGSLAEINKRIMACMILHNIMVEEQHSQDDTIENEVLTVTTPSALACVPDGVVVRSVQQSDGSVSHTVLEVTCPNTYGQDNCALEQPIRGNRGNTTTRCPKREELRVHIQNLEWAIRPESSRKRTRAENY
jgi:hypothetical protein